MTAAHELVEAWTHNPPAGWTLSGTAGLVNVITPGELTVAVAFGSAGVAATTHVDLTGSSIVVELREPPGYGDGSVEASFGLTDTGGGGGLSIRYSGHPVDDAGVWMPYLKAGYSVGSSVAQLVDVRPHNAARHRFWRIGELDGVVSWHVSPDGFDWTELGVWAVTFPIDDLIVGMGAGYWLGFGDPLVVDPAVFGPVNMLPALPADPLTTITTDGAAPNLAVDILPDVLAGTFTVGDSGIPDDGSLVDGDELLGWGGGEGWVNIVCDVTSLSGRRGATRMQGVLTRSEAGSIDLELSDPERRFDPTVNVDAVHPGTPLRVRAWGPGWSEVLFTGRVGDDVQVFYRRDEAPLVTLSVVDVIARLARYASTGHPDPGVGGGEDLLARVERVLDEAGAPDDAVAGDADRAFAARLAPTSLTSGWSPITDAADAELGRVWVSKHDRLVVRGRGSEMSGPVRGTLSDWHDEAVEGTVHCCYVDPVVRVGTELLATRAIAARRVTLGDTSATVTIDDAVAAARYTGGVPATMERRDLDLSTDGQLDPWARFVVAHGATPELRVDRVTPAPWNAPEAWPALAATDIGDRWAFRLHPLVGSTVIRTLGVLGIEFAITPESWSLTFHTVDATTPDEGNPGGWFLIGSGVDDGSEVDGGDLLWPLAPAPDTYPV